MIRYIMAIGLLVVIGTCSFAYTHYRKMYKGLNAQLVQSVDDSLSSIKTTLEIRANDKDEIVIDKTSLPCKVSYGKSSIVINGHSKHSENILNIAGILAIPYGQFDYIAVMHGDKVYRFHDVHICGGIYLEKAGILRLATGATLDKSIFSYHGNAPEKPNDNNMIIIQSGNSKTAQQVDSAEASTIAVPPSNPSGSPR